MFVRIGMTMGAHTRFSTKQWRSLDDARNMGRLVSVNIGSGVFRCLNIFNDMKYGTLQRKRVTFSAEFILFSFHLYAHSLVNKTRICSIEELIKET
jgi:hypothetical protein